MKSEYRGRIRELKSQGLNAPQIARELRISVGCVKYNTQSDERLAKTQREQSARRYAERGFSRKAITDKCPDVDVVFIAKIVKMHVDRERQIVSDLEHRAALAEQDADELNEWLWEELKPGWMN